MPDGYEVRGKSVRVYFRYDGELCREPIGNATPENIKRADILPAPLGLDQHFRQGSHIAQPEVQTLARNRVYAMGRVPHQRHARRGIFGRQREVERIGEARSLERDLSQKVAKTRAKDREEVIVRERGDGMSIRIRL